MAKELLQVASKHLQTFGTGLADVEGAGTANAAVHVLSLTTSAASNAVVSLSARCHELVACEASVVLVRKRRRVQYSVGGQWYAPVLPFQEESDAGVVGSFRPGLLLDGLFLVRDHGDLVLDVSALCRLEGFDRYSGSRFGDGAMIYTAK